MEEFIKKMKSKRKYFVGWKEEYSFDDGQETYFNAYTYTKGDYEISMDVDWRGWTPMLTVKKKGIEIVDIGEGQCAMLKEFNKNKIKKRVKKAYKKRGKRDKITGLNVYTNTEDLIDVYIEFLIENGILENKDS